MMMESKGKDRHPEAESLERNVLSFLAEMTLAPVTFSPASHHSLLFFILSRYTSASQIMDLLGFSSLSAPFGAQPFHQRRNKVQSEIFLKYPESKAVI